MSYINILRLLFMLAGYMVLEEIQLANGYDSPEKVNCGCHIAESCAQCGTQPEMCNGDCVWKGSKCASKNDTSTRPRCYFHPECNTVNYCKWGYHCIHENFCCSYKDYYGDMSPPTEQKALDYSLAYAGPDKAVFAGWERKQVTEGRTMSLTCLLGYSLYIKSAIYTKQGDTKCTNHPTADLSTVRARCQYARSCDIPVNNSEFYPDPCPPHTTKTLTVVYKCTGMGSLDIQEFQEFENKAVQKYENETCSIMEPSTSLSHGNCSFLVWLKCLKYGYKDYHECKTICKGGYKCTIACIIKKLDSHPRCKKCIKALLKAICCHFIPKSPCCDMTDEDFEASYNIAATTGPTTMDATTANVTTTPGCPSMRPEDNSPCYGPQDLECEYGRQECCGEIFPDVIMICYASSWITQYVDSICILHGDDYPCSTTTSTTSQPSPDPTTSTKQATATATSITTTIATTSNATTSTGDDGSCDKNNYTLVLTGGDNPQRLNSSEQISFTGVCSSPNIPQLPEAITGGKSVWFEPNTLMFCGGSTTYVVGAPVSGATNKCLKLTPGNNAWENNDAFNMNVDRSYFSLNYIDGYGAIAAGGHNNDNTVLDSLEKYSDGEWKKIENIKLDKPTYTHCAVQYTKRDGDSYLMIIGGSNTYGVYDITASVTEINLSTGDKVSVAPGSLPGLWAPACTICGDDIYVSGGGKKNGDDVGIASSTDVYKYNIPAGGPFTLLTGKLKTPRWGHTMGVTSKGQLVVSGGYRQPGYLASIESSEDGGASWKTWAPALSTKQAAAAMASVPAFTFTCTD